MRGKVNVTIVVLGGDRITPAYAGKRLTHLYDDIGQPDHPRVCGEKLLAFCILQPAQGSPPRMRGKDPPASTGEKSAGSPPRMRGKAVALG